MLERQHGQQEFSEDTTSESLRARRLIDVLKTRRVLDGRFVVTAARVDSHRRGTWAPELADISGFINAAYSCSSRGPKLGLWVWFMGVAVERGPPVETGWVEHVSALTVYHHNQQVTSSRGRH